MFGNPILNLLSVFLGAIRLARGKSHTEISGFLVILELTCSRDCAAQVVALDSELLMSCFKTNKNKTKITGTWSNPALVQTTSPPAVCVCAGQRPHVAEG